MPPFVVIAVIRLVIYLFTRKGGAAGIKLGAVMSYASTAAVRVAFVYFALDAWRDHNSLLCYLLLLVAWPQPLLSLVLIPAGIPYLPYWFTYAVRPQAVVNEARGGAVFNELRARVYWGRMLRSSSMARFASDLFKPDKSGSDKRMRGATVSARAVLDALSADGEQARALFSVVQDMNRWHGTRSIRSYAQSWLLADAARRGAYHEVARLSWRGPSRRRRMLMRGAARRLLSRPDAPRDLALWFWWLAAPGRRQSLELLRYALRAGPRPPLEIDGETLP